MRIKASATNGHRVMGLLIFYVGLFGIVPPTKSQENAPANSTRKIRVQPGALAMQIGRGIPWEKSLETAMEKARATGKHVFWYIPSVPGTFMDRQIEIDRYMLAGPLSWNATREVICQQFVSFKGIPTQQQQEAFGLLRYDFIEPGFLILDGQSRVVRRVDRLTTFHPEWWLALLRPFVPSSDGTGLQSRELGDVWGRIARREFDGAWEPADVNWPPVVAVEWEWLRGVAQFRRGHHQRATEIWRDASQRYPDEPLAWKLAAEAEGFGPFVRGFEVYEPLPEALLAEVARQDYLTSAAAPYSYSEQEIWQRAVNYLLGMQREDGGWFDSDYDFGGTDSLPNVHLAVTALCGLALFEARGKLPARASEIQAALDRAVAYVVNDAHLNRADRDELSWAYAYRVQLLARMVAERPEWREALQTAVQDLEKFQSPQGGWFHEYPNPFVSATALYALAAARDAGATLDQAQVEKGIQSLRGDRMNNGAFPYLSGQGGRAVPREGTLMDVKGSVGRSPICTLALRRWDATDDASLASSVARSFEHHALLQKALKYDDHTDQLGYGGFFFWYGVYGRSLAIDELNDVEQRAAFHRQQRELILSLPEMDGNFVDSHELGRCYGTALALMSLSLASKANEPISNRPE